MSDLQKSEVITENIDLKNWNCGGDYDHINEELSKSVREGYASMPILWEGSGSDGWSGETPDEATSIYFTMFLGNYSDSEETKIKISLKNCVEDVIYEVSDNGLDRLEKDMSDILSNIQAEQKKRSISDGSS